MSYKNMIEISPSILSADFANISSEVSALEKAGANRLHLDVMDGHFVPNITFGPDMVKAIRNITDLPLEVHLMIENVGHYIPDFINAGADFIVIHAESEKHIHRNLELIKNHGKKCGIALNPATPISSIENIIDIIDIAIIMTVNPGFGGQKFIESQLKKIRTLRGISRDIDIAVDGGINKHTAAHAVNAGANVLIAGSAIIDKSLCAETYKNNIEDILDSIP